MEKKKVILWGAGILIVAVLGIIFGGPAFKQEKKTDKSEVQELSAKLDEVNKQLGKMATEVSNLNKVIREQETSLKKFQKDMEKDFSEEKYDPVTGKLTYRKASSSKSSEGSTEELSKVKDENESLRTEKTQVEQEKESLRNQLDTAKRNIKSIEESLTVRRGRILFGGGVDVTDLVNARSTRANIMGGLEVLPGVHAVLQPYSDVPGFREWGCFANVVFK